MLSVGNFYVGNKIVFLNGVSGVGVMQGLVWYSGNIIQGVGLGEFCSLFVFSLLGNFQSCSFFLCKIQVLICIFSFVMRLNAFINK